MNFCLGKAYEMSPCKCEVQEKKTAALVVCLKKQKKT